MRMRAKVTLSQYHPVLVEEIRQLLRSWGFDACGRGPEAGWCGLWEAPELKKTSAPEKQSCAAKPCTHKHLRDYMPHVYICEDCEVLLGDL